MGTVQRDMFIEKDDEFVVKGDRHLQELVNALPVKTLLSVTEVRKGLGASNDTVYRWITAGKFSYFNYGTTERPSYKVIRSSLIEFLKSRKVEGWV